MYLISRPYNSRDQFNRRRVRDYDDINFVDNANRQPIALSPPKYFSRQLYVPNYAQHSEEHHIPFPNSDYLQHPIANQVHATDFDHESHAYFDHEPPNSPLQLLRYVNSPLRLLPFTSPPPSLDLSELDQQNLSVPQLIQLDLSGDSAKLSSTTAGSIHSQSPDRRDYRRVFGLFFCARCELQWESPDTFETTNHCFVDAQNCPDCLLPIMPFKTRHLCVFCDGFPCRCCGQCESFPCKCCERCDRSPCQCRRDECCDDCNRFPCRCVCNGCKGFQTDCSCEVRVYGFYRCSQCGKTWESAYTFIRGGGKTGQKAKFAKVMYGQQCKGCACEDFVVARKWERIVCQKCLVKPCACKDKRHIDHDKNHMQALCERCKNKADPCSSFRFEFNTKEEQAEEVREAEQRGRGISQLQQTFAQHRISLPSISQSAPLFGTPNMSMSAPMMLMQ